MESTQPITNENEQKQPTDSAPALNGLKRGQLAKEEERKGIIKFVAVTNDGKRDSMIILTGLKNIYQKQLPMMPKEYIARLVYDRNHASMAIVKKNLNVVGGITYRWFPGRKFSEIVFCAITGTGLLLIIMLEQVKGYGSYLMNHLKDHVRKTTDTEHFLTYADNYAVGYFKKQGFTADITISRSIWAGFIKDYEGGTIMECTMVPRIKYLEVNEIIEQQKKAIQEKIQKVNQEAKKFPGLRSIKEGKILEPFEIPGLLESGWHPDMEKPGKQANPLAPLLKQLLQDLVSQTWSWPFRDPVDPDVVPNYYEVIKNPVDLKTMDERIDKGYYKNLDAFVKDFDQMIENCKKFNDIKSVYVKCATKLDQIFKQRLKTIEDYKLNESSQ